MEDRDLLFIKENFERILSNTAGYIYIKNSQSQYVWCNNNVAKVSGLDNPSQIVGKRDIDFEWGKEGAQSFIEYDQEVMRTGKTLVTENTLIIDTQGHSIHVKTEKIPLIDNEGKVRGVLGIALDITDQKIALDKLEEALNKIAEENRNKDNLLRIISERSRTLLNTTTGHLSLLINKEANQLKKENLKTALQGVLDTISMIDSIKKYIDFTQDREINFDDNFNLESIIQDVVKKYNSAIEEKDVDLVVSYPMQFNRYFSGNSSLVYSAIKSVLENAIKYTTQGFILVSVNEDISRNEIYCVVEDTGCGINQDYLKYLLDPFNEEQPDPLNMGLSLSILKTSLKKLGGDLVIESILGKGTTVKIRLPLHQTDLSHEIKKYSFDAGPVGVISHNSAFISSLLSFKKEIDIKIIDSDQKLSTQSLPRCIVVDLPYNLDEAKSQLEKIYPFLQSGQVLMVLSKVRHKALLQHTFNSDVQLYEIMKPLFINDIFAKLTHRKIKVMIVEDDKMASEIHRQILEELGHSCVIAYTAKEALKYFDDEIQLVMLDLGLPDMDGLKLAETLREKFSHPFSIVAVTAKDSLKELDEHFPECIAALIRKPVTLELVRETIQSILEENNS